MPDAGVGFIALAAVILGRWSPLGAYLAPILALVGLVEKPTPPASSGGPYRRAA